jgi:hypothetical protein
MNLTTEIVNELYEELAPSQEVFAVYPGRFQPPGPHHYKTYEWLVHKFGRDHVFIATSNVVSLPNSPLSFAEKRAVWMKQGVSGDKVVLVKNPYQCSEILDNLPDGAVVVFGYGKKDADRFSVGTKKDGSPSYLQMYEPNKHKLEDFLLHSYLIVLPHFSVKLNGKELSGTEIRQVLAHDHSRETFTKIFGWYDEKLSAMLYAKFQPPEKKELAEGGHLFGSDPIEQKNLEPTAEAYFAELRRLFPRKADVFTYNQQNLLGSAFKKDTPSGDIDVAFAATEFYKGNITDWNLSPAVVKAKTEELLKRAINYKKAVKAGDKKAIEYHMFLKQQEATNILISMYINAHSELITTKPEEAKPTMIMTAVPQFGSDGNPVLRPPDGLPLMAQVDINIGNLDWLRFSSFSADYRRNVANMSAELKSVYGDFDKLPYKSEIKGAHRTQLILSMFEYLGLSFSHQEGVKDKATGKVLAFNADDAVKILNDRLKLNGALTREIIDNYHLLHKFLREKLPEATYKAIIDIFLKQRLESQRLDIPADLVDYWKQNKERLGLTGKFNPNVQNLAESGVAGGSRISKENVQQTIEDYMAKVIKPKFGDIPYKIAGSYNLGTKSDHGDIDLILNFGNPDREKVKAELSTYLSSLPDDVVVPFTSAKYRGKKLHKSGELISVLYPIVGQKGQHVQIDNILATSGEEHAFKFEFLKLPAENQGLILGLVKTALLDNAKLLQSVVKLYGALEQNQEYEYNLSSEGVTLRLITYDPKLLHQGTYKETDRKMVKKSTNWGEIEKILPQYDLNTNFDELLKQIKTKASDRAKRRIIGVFKSMITVKSGEEGTPKGENKEIARKKVDYLLA